MAPEQISAIWLCNIRSDDGQHYSGREVTVDDAGAHRDGAIYNLRDGAFERLLAAGEIDQMEMFPQWYEGTQIPISEVVYE